MLRFHLPLIERARGSPASGSRKTLRKLVEAKDEAKDRRRRARWPGAPTRTSENSKGTQWTQSFSIVCIPFSFLPENKIGLNTNLQSKLCPFCRSHCHSGGASDAMNFMLAH